MMMVKHYELFSWDKYNGWILLEYYEIVGSSRSYIEVLFWLKVSYKSKDYNRGWFNPREPMNLRRNFDLVRFNIV